MAKSDVAAAIDVGSNSVHLLVASIERDRLRPLLDESELLGLGDVVDRQGELPPAAQVALLAALKGYVKGARKLGARSVTVVATEPFRRAANGRAVAEALGSQLGIPVKVVTPTQEGELTYLGVTGGVPSPEGVLVVDIGGGSSEVIVALPGEAPSVTSLPTGSSRLSAGLVSHDPPTAAELDALLAAAHGAVTGLDEARPLRAVFVGGTATNLARIAPLSRDGVALAYRVLAACSVAELVERYRVNPRRARQLPAGAALVDALLAHFRIDEASVSDASLRDGAIIAAHRLGSDWPQRSITGT